MKCLSILIMMILVFGSCNIIDRERIRGNGNVTTRSFDLKDFSSVDIEDNMEVIVRQDPAVSVKVTTDENLQQYINVNIENGNLVIKYRNDINLNPTNNVKVYISVPSLDKIEVGSASDLRTDGKFSQDKKLSIDLSEASSGNLSVRAPVVEMKASEASTLTVEGESRDIKAQASEASTINAYNLKAENGEAHASEVSTIHVFSSVSLKIDASEASTVKYKGSPNVTSDVQEASSVGKAD
ncbi:MAG: head GIN domain-containing protein [Niabella sp.]